MRQVSSRKFLIAQLSICTISCALRSYDGHCSGDFLPAPGAISHIEWDMMVLNIGAREHSSEDLRDWHTGHQPLIEEQI